MMSSNPMARRPIQQTLGMGGAYALSLVNQSDASQSAASVSSTKGTAFFL